MTKGLKILYNFMVVSGIFSHLVLNIMLQTNVIILKRILRVNDTVIKVENSTKRYRVPLFVFSINLL